MLSTSIKMLSGGLLISAILFSTLKNDVVIDSKSKQINVNSLVGNSTQSAKLKNDINNEIVSLHVKKQSVNKNVEEKRPDILFFLADDIMSVACEP